MYDRSSALILRWLKVPPEPHAPHGNPASLRVFRAGRNYFNLRLFSWGVGQVLALAGIVFWLVVFVEIEATVQQRRQSGVAPAAPTTAQGFADYIRNIGNEPAGGETKPAAGTAAPNPPPRHRNRVRINSWADFKQILVAVAMALPAWSFPLLWALKLTGFVAYLVQVPLTYAVRRLDYEMRWYMVTDRSLRIRHGVWKISESTMSFANIQQVVVTQDPLQRLLGLADVRVQSAGGGSGGRSEEQKQRGEDMHLGLFHGVTNAAEIRDLILDRLRRFRESGLGDPDDRPVHAHPVPAGPQADPVAAARELLAEAQALRAALANR